MTSQVSENTRDVLINELSVGDMILGTDNARWGAKYKVLKVPTGINNDSVWTDFLLERVDTKESCYWRAHKFWVVVIEDKTFKYDPRQAGDTDDDV